MKRNPNAAGHIDLIPDGRVAGLSAEGSRRTVSRHYTERTDSPLWHAPKARADPMRLVSVKFILSPKQYNHLLARQRRPKPVQPCPECARL